MEAWKRSSDGITTTIGFATDDASGFSVGDEIEISGSGGGVCEILKIDRNMVTISPIEDEFRKEVRKITEKEDKPNGGFSRKIKPGGKNETRSKGKYGAADSKA